MSIPFVHIGSLILISLITILLAYLVNRLLIRIIRQSTIEMRTNPVTYHFVRRILVVVIYIIGFGIAINSVPSLKTLAGSLLAGAGILAVAVGFASQQALSNVISGLFIILFKPFKLNDRIEINQMIGIVEDITLRHVIIRNFKNERIIIPNSVISQQNIINADHLDTFICKFIDVGISYNSDLKKAKQIIASVIESHPLFVDNRSEEMKLEGTPIVPVRVLQLADSAIILRGWAWAKNAGDGFVLSCDVLESIKLTFDENNIEIPFPQRTIHMK